MSSAKVAHSVKGFEDSFTRDACEFYKTASSARALESAFGFSNSRKAYAYLATKD
jgi:hypothetical protein